jgi:hypothetical protein
MWRLQVCRRFENHPDSQEVFELLDRQDKGSLTQEEVWPKAGARSAWEDNSFVFAQELLE